MSIFDISLLVIWAGFTLNGLFKGIIKILGNFFGLIIGAYLASHYYLLLFDWWKDIFKEHQSFGKVISFLVLFFIVAFLVSLIFKLIEKFFNLIAIIPGSKYLNNLAGALLGCLVGALFLGLIIFVSSRYALIGNFFGVQLAASVIAPILLKVTNLILPLLPEALKALKSII